MPDSPISHVGSIGAAFAEPGKDRELSPPAANLPVPGVSGGVQGLARVPNGARKGAQLFREFERRRQGEGRSEKQDVVMLPGGEMLLLKETPLPAEESKSDTQTGGRGAAGPGDIGSANVPKHSLDDAVAAKESRSEETAPATATNPENGLSALFPQMLHDVRQHVERAHASENDPGRREALSGLLKDLDALQKNAARPSGNQSGDSEVRSDEHHPADPIAEAKLNADKIRAAQATEAFAGALMEFYISHLQVMGSIMNKAMQASIDMFR